MNRLPTLCDADLSAVEAKMKTRAHRRRVEKLKTKVRAGTVTTFEEMATFLGMPLQIVLAIFQKHMREEHGLHIRPVVAEGALH